MTISKTSHTRIDDGIIARVSTSTFFNSSSVLVTWLNACMNPDPDQRVWRSLEVQAQDPFGCQFTGEVGTPKLRLMRFWDKTVAYQNRIHWVNDIQVVNPTYSWRAEERAFEGGRGDDEAFVLDPLSLVRPGCLSEVLVGFLRLKHVGLSSATREQSSLVVVGSLLAGLFADLHGVITIGILTVKEVLDTDLPLAMFIQAIGMTNHTGMTTRAEESIVVLD